MSVSPAKFFWKLHARITTTAPLVTYAVSIRFNRGFLLSTRADAPGCNIWKWSCSFFFRCVARVVVVFGPCNKVCGLWMSERANTGENSTSVRKRRVVYFRPSSATNLNCLIKRDEILLHRESGPQARTHTHTLESLQWELELHFHWFIQTLDKKENRAREVCVHSEKKKKK